MLLLLVVLHGHSSVVVAHCHLINVVVVSMVVGRILVTIGVSCRLSYAMLHQETHIASVTLPIAGGCCLVVGATVLLVARTYSTSLRVDSSAMG